VRALLASPLGFLVGLSLGALGGGGSILAVPALVYGVGESPQAATATSLLVVGFAAMVGVIPHWRNGNVRMGAGVLFGLAGVGGSFVGTTLNGGVDGDVLLLAFSGFMIVAGAAMLRRSRRAEPADVEPADAAVPSVRSASTAASAGTSSVTAPAAGFSSGAGAATGAGDGAATGDRSSIGPLTDVPMGPVASAEASGPADVGPSWDVATVVKVVLAGSVVGLLTGFFGVGGGFVIVPALVLTLGFTMPQAVGTSLVVIAINAAVALAMRAGSSTIEWADAAPFLVTAVAGTIVGGRIAGRIDARRLTGAFVVLLVGVALYTGITALVAIVG
jgi:uncharacterized membrane protein YfcA